MNTRKDLTPSYPLTIELVPEPCWYSNMRNAMPKKQWDALRKQVYQDSHRVCGICGASSQLNCHEIWDYDDVNHIQKLTGFIALCSLCHHVKHSGLAHILAQEGKLDLQKVRDHFCRVNACEPSTYEQCYNEAIAQWNKRNQHEWKTDLGAYVNLVRDAQVKAPVAEAKAPVVDRIIDFSKHFPNPVSLAAIEQEFLADRLMYLSAQLTPAIFLQIYHVEDAHAPSDACDLRLQALHPDAIEQEEEDGIWFTGQEIEPFDRVIRHFQLDRNAPIWWAECEKEVQKEEEQ